MSERSWDSSEEFLGEYTTTVKGMKMFGIGLELIGAILVTATAIYLRITDLHPTDTGLNWKVICADLTLTADIPSDDNTILLYVLVIVVPALFIIILELEHTCVRRNPRFENLSKRARMCKSLPRYASVFGLFIVGIFITSFFADYLMIVVARPRPYFITTYGNNCPSAYNGTLTDAYYDALKSFPSHLASVASFCCMFAMGHAHVTRQSRGFTVLLPIMIQGFVVLSTTAGIYDYTSRHNHLWDVIWGLVIGLVVAIYTSSLLRESQELSQDQEKSRKWTDFWNMFIPRARVTLPPTNAEARNVMPRSTD